jgi:hypothetical protein
VTVDVTANTDFAQVEVDEQQVNLTRFNLFFPEKRDFFLENLGTFAFAGRASAGLGAGSGVTPYLFFSRRIGLDGGRVPPLRAGGRLSGKAGRFTMGLLSVRTGELSPLEGQSQGIEPATFTVARAKRDILRRSSIGAMVTHRSATPGRVGSNLGYGLDATFSFYQNVRFDTYLAGTQTEGRSGDDLSYRGLFDYNGDRYGFTAERLVVEPNFLPEIGFLRRTDMRRNFVQTRFSPRPTRIPHVRKFTTQASINYLTNNQNRLDTREIVGLFQTELVNTDVAGIMYTDTFDRPVRPFDVATGVRIPVGGYDFHTLQLSYTGGQQRKISGAIVYETGTYYGGTQQSISVSAARWKSRPHVARTERVGQLRRSASGVLHRDRPSHARDVHRHPAHVRQRHRPVQLDDAIDGQQSAPQMGICARQRAVRRVHGRLRHRVRPSVDRPPKPRLCHQGDSPVSTMTGTRRRSHSDDSGTPGPSVGLS